MIERTFNFDKVEKAVNGYADFTPAPWLFDEKNIALASGDNVSLFEYQREGVYYGHYFFTDARGRSAITLAKEMLSEMFNNREASVIIGITPNDNKAALWMNKKLGFTTVETGSENTSVYLTKDQFNNG